MPYPEAPPGWTPVSSRKVGPFTTHRTFRRPDGTVARWSSREHRKLASRLSRPGASGSVWWAPGRASWWIGVLFALGSACFAVAPFPGFVTLVGSSADGSVFFAGSIAFTSAALLQYLETVNADRRLDGTARRRFRVLTFEPRRIDWWATTIQLAGTVLFNISTWDALQASLSTQAENRLVWAPDTLGSICFLVASYLAYAEVCGGPGCRPRRSLSRWIATVNLAGSVAFGISALASFVVPSTGDVLDLAAVNAWTVIGALGFLAGAVMLLPESAPPRAGRAAIDEAATPEVA